MRPMRDARSCGLTREKNVLSWPKADALVGRQYARDRTDNVGF